MDVKEAVFYSKEKPELLANIINALLGEDVENLSADIVLEGKSVDNGTELSAIKATLPTSLKLSTAKGLPFSATITWGADTTPTYAKTTAGDYVLEGTLSNLPVYVTNTDSKKVKVTITVKEAES